MHLPDGFLDARTCLATAALSAGALTLAYRSAVRRTGDRTVPLLGTMGAFVFAAQMLNFPVGFGASGYLLGSTLAVVCLGLAPAMWVMTSVLVLQCLVFQDGGLLALGANVLNMAVVGCVVSAAVSRVGVPLGASPRRFRFTVGVAAWASVVAGAAACAVELAAAGRVALLPAVATLGGIHAVIGLGEAAITVAVLGFLVRQRPDLVAGHPARPEEPGTPFHG
ncbi:MAG: energy-coupling factor ABC transporter permease [Candidatus Riflebacteria bacterium]|nr:energy-coupling factor ABC transporter permease [Candidatus Riflebacteria bacterium]